MSLFGEIADAATNLFSVGSNAYWNNKTYKAQQRQQRFQNDFAMNQMQYRAADLGKAGLHPTLALGNTGHSPASASGPHVNPQNAHGRVMENALMSEDIRQRRAQRELIQAEAAKIRKETEMIDPEFSFNVSRVSQEMEMAAKRIELDSHRYGLDVIRYYDIDFPTHQQRIEFERDLHELEKEQRRLNIDNTKLGNWFKQFSNWYASENHATLPMDEIAERALRKITTLDPTLEEAEQMGFFKKAALVWLRMFAKKPSSRLFR